MTDNRFSNKWGEFTLNRQPQVPTLPLRAWDAADEYLLNLVPDEIENVTVVNDNFGALTISLHQQLQQSWTDSALMTHATSENASLNNIDFEQLNSKIVKMSELPATPLSLILMKIPRSNRLFTWQLAELSKLAPMGTKLWLSGMDKHITKNQFELVERYFGETQALRGQKKARVWQSVNNKPDSSVEMYSESYVLPDSDIKLCQTPGVFSGDKLDLGSRFFLQHFNRLPEATDVIDLGCGNGLLAIRYQQKFPSANLMLIDESSHAIDCAMKNVTTVFGEQHQCTTLHADSTSEVKPDSVPLIICNPPFHQGNSINTELALHLFKGAEQSLSKNGQLWIVANRHLNYKAILKRLFGNCQLQVQNSKFVILSAVKS